MPRNPSLRQAALLAALTALPVMALADGAHDHSGGITADATSPAPFDIVHTTITTEGNVAIFHMAVSGAAGESRPSATGALAGSQVFAYVWPTSLDAGTVGFEPGAGILALAATAHPDFDDTPLFDENGDGVRDNDGDLWHSHWVVLGPDEACGTGALKVIDIPEGATPPPARHLARPAASDRQPRLATDPERRDGRGPRALRRHRRGQGGKLRWRDGGPAGECRCPRAASVRDRRVRCGLGRSEPARQGEQLMQPRAAAGAPPVS